MITENTLFELFGYYEKDRFIRVSGDYYDIRCPHPEPRSVSVPAEPSFKQNISIVRLNRYADSKGTSIGWAGKCEVCGKVYYR